MACCDIIHQLRFGEGRNRNRRRAGQQVQVQRALVESWLNQHGLLWFMGYSSHCFECIHVTETIHSADRNIPFI